MPLPPTRGASDALDDLCAELDLRGGCGAAQVLMDFARLHGRGAWPILERALREGSDPIRETAIREMARIDRAATEPHALRVLASDPVVDVRAGACDALSGCASEASFDALVSALHDGFLASVFARKALVQHASAFATDRIERMAVAALAGDPNGGQLLLGVLSGRDQERAVPYLIVTWLTASSVGARLAAGKLLFEGRTPRGRIVLLSSIEQRFYKPLPTKPEKDRDCAQILALGLAAALRDDPARAFERLSPFLLDCARAETQPPPWEQIRADMLHALLEFVMGSWSSSALADVGMALMDDRCRLDPRWEAVLEAAFVTLDSPNQPPEATRIRVWRWQLKEWGQPREGHEKG